MTVPKPPHPDDLPVTHDGPLLLDSRDVAFVVTADHDGHVHIINNLGGTNSDFAVLLRDVADRLESQ